MPREVGHAHPDNDKEGGGHLAEGFHLFSPGLTLSHLTRCDFMFRNDLQTMGCLLLLNFKSQVGADRVYSFIPQTSIDYMGSVGEGWVVLLEEREN